MSQIYHVALKSTVCESFTLSDTVTHKLNLTLILDEVEMKEILRSVLLRRGFEVSDEAETLLIKENERGEEVSFDLERNEVRVTSRQVQELSTEVVAQGTFDLDFVDRKKAQRDVEDQLADRREGAYQKLRNQAAMKQNALTAQLAGQVEEQQRDLNQLLKEVYAESVKRKAQRLGEVMEISEATVDGQYELVIKVEC